MGSTSWSVVLALAVTAMCISSVASAQDVSATVVPGFVFELTYVSGFGSSAALRASLQSLLQLPAPPVIGYTTHLPPNHLIGTYFVVLTFADSAVGDLLEEKMRTIGAPAVAHALGAIQIQLDSPPPTPSASIALPDPTTVPRPTSPLLSTALPPPLPTSVPGLSFDLTFVSGMLDLSALQSALKTCLGLSEAPQFSYSTQPPPGGAVGTYILHIVFYDPAVSVLLATRIQVLGAPVVAQQLGALAIRMEGTAPTGAPFPTAPPPPTSTGRRLHTAWIVVLSLGAVVALVGLSAGGWYAMRSRRAVEKDSSLYIFNTPAAAPEKKVPVENDLLV